MKLELIEDPQQTISRQLKLSAEETLTIDKEVNKLLDKKVVSESRHEPNECVFSLFTRPKKVAEKE